MTTAAILTLVGFLIANAISVMLGWQLHRYVDLRRRARINRLLAYSDKVFANIAARQEPKP